MLQISLHPWALRKIYSILKEEDDNTCLRVREFKIGTINNPLKIVLGLCVDEREEDDLEAETAAIAFIMNRELTEQYGSHFSISLGSHGAFEIAPVPPGKPEPAPAAEPRKDIIWHNSFFCSRRRNIPC